MADKPLKPGVYETLKTPELVEKVQQSELVPRYETVATGEEGTVLTQEIVQRLRHHLTGLEPEEQIKLGAKILELVGGKQAEPTLEQEKEQTDKASQLKIATLAELREDNLNKEIKTPRPTTPLGGAALLTNNSNEPSVGSELKAELASADSVDLLCAFVKWSGMRLLEDELKALSERGKRLRVITTTYIGATERAALDRLVNEYGAEVKVNYDTRSTRLHAKAWLFRRESGFDTAYVGSSNLSKAAMLDGVEWNVRLGRDSGPDILRKFQATFDSYWEDARFETYKPDRDQQKLERALAEARGYDENGSDWEPELSGLEVHPYPFQQEILEKLKFERAHNNRHRNLVVAATGTGKTVIAAFDYKQICEEYGRQPRFLFIAHRAEILKQSLRTYREILGDANFGQTWVGGAVPTNFDHVFASIQTLHNQNSTEINPDAYEYIVIDEFHHAEAPTYRKIIDHFRPAELLGLTATPERADGVNVKQFFDNHYTAEWRLWDALEADLLVPFHYFGINDEVDLSNVTWRAGKYVESELSKVYTGDQARTRLIVRQLQDKLVDLAGMKALGFCVDINHSEFMAAEFSRFGIPARAVTSRTSAEDRKAAIAALKAGTIKCIFSVDVFNEGVDIPAVNTVLMLRPTESSTIFLQQLGRGLRKHSSKSVLTVLDFVGMQNKAYRFETKFRALTGAGRAALRNQVEKDFPFLPSGCQIVLDRVTQKRVLENIKQNLSSGIRGLSADVISHIGTRELADYRLADFLRETDRDLADVYGRHSWTLLKRYAGENNGLPFATISDEEEKLLKRLKMLVAASDETRREAYRKLLTGQGDDLGGIQRERYATMLLLLFWPNPKVAGISSVQAGLEKLRSYRYLCAEAVELLDLLSAQTAPVNLPELLPGNLLCSHATYHKTEILAALGYATIDKPQNNHREGVAWIGQVKTDVLFVQLRKSDRDFSPSTMYHDYALSQSVFHWESQNKTSPESVVGQRYIDHRSQGSKVLLFVREFAGDEFGTSPYMCLGYVDYRGHRGRQPMQIEWELERPMPLSIYRAASAVAR